MLTQKCYLPNGVYLQSEKFPAWCWLQNSGNSGGYSSRSRVKVFTGRKQNLTLIFNSTVWSNVLFTMMKLHYLVLNNLTLEY